MTRKRRGRWVPCLVRDSETGVLKPCIGHQKESSGRPVPGNFDEFIEVKSLDAARDICGILNRRA